MEAFNTLSQQIGEENMLSLCYRFMTFAVSRPSEEQRVLLEEKFEQDRRFENLRRILENSEAEAEEAPTEIVEAPVEAPVDEAKVNRKANAKILARAEKYWPFMRVKNVIKSLRRADGTFEYRNGVLTFTGEVLEHYGLQQNARFSHMTGLEVLAARKKISVEQLLDTSPHQYFGSHEEASRMMCPK
jgi:hypothetical protein